jgi:hypothetical protein
LSSLNKPQRPEELTIEKENANRTAESSKVFPVKAEKSNQCKTPWIAFRISEHHFCLLVFDEVSEGALVRDLIFVFQGIDGTYLKYNQKLRSYAPISGIDISPPYRNTIQKLAEMGTIYKAIQSELQTRRETKNGGLTTEVSHGQQCVRSSLILP